MLPALLVDGYRKFAPLHYGRIRNDVFQFLVVHASDDPQPEFLLESSSMLLCEPHNFLTLDIGGRFPDEQAGKVYRASSTADWTPAVEFALMDYLATCRPRMEASSSLNGLMDRVFTLLGSSGSPHLWFTLAVGHARMGAEQRARELGQEALTRYRQCGEANAAATWTKKGEQRCEFLIRELYSTKTERLLDGWRAGTVSALGLEALLHEV